jgi:hypothetical protein
VAGLALAKYPIADRMVNRSSSTEFAEENAGALDWRGLGGEGLMLFLFMCAYVHTRGDRKTLASGNQLARR